VRFAASDGWAERSAGLRFNFHHFSLDLTLSRRFIGRADLRVPSACLQAV